MKRLGLLLLTCLILTPAATRRRESFDFRYDILPILHRQGCGSAYCHGSATGRGGFKLSLFASDPAADHVAITRDLGGRRLDLRTATDSLLIKKPGMRTSHGGGRRLRKGTAAYDAIVRWIDSGAPFRTGSRRELLALQLKHRDNRLRAIAKFRSNAGEFESDVTDLCTFSSSDERVAAVDTNGNVTLGRPGEAWLFARYVGQSARIAVVQPFPRWPVAEAAVAGGSHPLDKLWLQRLHELGLQPAPRAKTNEIARRLYIDLVDRVPTPAELKAFQDVATTADALMKTREFAVKFGRLLATWFEIPIDPPARAIPQTKMFNAQHQRLVAAVARGETLHEIVEGLLLRDRRLLERFQDPRDRAELTGRAFLGVRIGCARCHNSPVDRWEQKNHLAFSALFASQRPKAGGGMRPGILFHPETGAPVQPQVLPVPTNGGRPAESEHEMTVAWFVLRAGHEMFERNMANRVFAAVMGKGLVEPLDDHRTSNPARHHSLLVHLAKQARSGDLRALVQHIVTSRLYQTTSEHGGSSDSEAQVQFFARRAARPMTPHTFAHVVAAALDAAPRSRLPRSPLARQLAILNSDALHSAVAESKMLHGIVDFAPDARARLRDAFVLLLSREPRETEVTAFLPTAKEPDGIRDLAFALLASREFGSIR